MASMSQSLADLVTDCEVTVAPVYELQPTIGGRPTSLHCPNSFLLWAKCSFIHFTGSQNLPIFYFPFSYLFQSLAVLNALPPLCGNAQYCE